MDYHLRYRLLENVNILLSGSLKFVRCIEQRDLRNAQIVSRAPFRALNDLLVELRNQADHDRELGVHLTGPRSGRYVTGLSQSFRHADPAHAQLPGDMKVEDADLRTVLNKNAHKNGTISGFRIENGRHFLVSSGKEIKAVKGYYVLESDVALLCSDLIVAIDRMF